MTKYYKVKPSSIFVINGMPIGTTIQVREEDIVKGFLIDKIMISIKDITSNFDRLYLKGTKIKLWCCTHDYQSDEEDIIILEEDSTEGEIEDMAKDFFYESKQPEWGFNEDTTEE